MSRAKPRQSARARTHRQRRGLLSRIRQSRLARRCCSGPGLLLFLMVFASSRCTSMPPTGKFPSPAAGLAAAIPCDATAVDKALVRRAEKDPAGLLEKAIQWHDANLRDYEGTFVVQQFKDGRARISAVCNFKFRTTPFSVVMRWIKGAGRVDRLLYVEGKNEGKMIVRPTGFIGRLFPAAAVDPHGKRATKGGLQPITEFGLRNALERVLKSFREDADRGTLQSSCPGVGELNGCRVLTLEKVGPEGKLIVELETKTLLPVRVRLYDVDGGLSASYEYSELRFNRDFTDATFSRKANGL